LSQDTVRIVQQFNSQGRVPEQQAYITGYPLQDDFSLHFVNADMAHNAQNEEPFNTIEEPLSSDATEEFTEKMKFNVVRGYLQRRPRRISPWSTKPPIFTGNADCTIRDLLVMIPDQL
jgi:hypothetical protein